MRNSRAIFLISIIISAALSRLVPHAPNLAPMTAVALFGGAYLSDRRLAFIVPLAALLLSDAILGFYEPSQMIAVYLSTGLAAAIGLTIRNRRSVLRVATAAIAASLTFFAVTNFAVWAFGAMYPHNGTGLLQCFIAALPFFRNTLAGDLLYSALLFGGFALLERRVTLLRDRTAPAR